MRVVVVGGRCLRVVIGIEGRRGRDRFRYFESYWKTEMNIIGYFP